MTAPRRLGARGPAVRQDEQPLGAIPDGRGGCQFLLFAPLSERVTLVVEGGDSLPSERRIVMDAAVQGVGEKGGYFSAFVDDCPPGTRYSFSLDGGQLAADPASRHQPDGVHGSSAVFDPAAHNWGDRQWQAPPLSALSIMEVHVGTFTRTGTFDSAADALAHLVELGVGAVEVMPIAQFPGERNWGYDGVFPFAAQSSYGGPAGFQRFVDACHSHGIAVVLDVVYNHLGPEGNVLPLYGPYFTDRYKTPWGAAINYDGEGSDEVRRYFVENALGWLSDFHVDMLRLDAVHGIVDPTAKPFLAELSEAVAEQAVCSGRPASLIAESADNNPRVVTARSSGGLGMDAQWNDDFHHALHAVATGERIGYYEDFGSLEQLARAHTHGFVYEGQYSRHRKRRHGASSVGIAPSRFVVFAQNHDHIGNRPQGERLSVLVAPEMLRLVAAVVLLAPGVPLLFMGEEYGASQPFAYFVDHGDPELTEAVRSGRAEEFAFGWDEAPLDAASPETYRAAVLDLDEAKSGDGACIFALHAGLLRLRKSHDDLSHSASEAVAAWVEGTVLRTRRGRVECGFNFSDQVSEVALPVPESGRWILLADGDDRELGGTGTLQPPASPEPREGIRMEPFAWWAYELKGATT